MSTVNVLGQYVLSDPSVVVHLFSKRAPRACTAQRLPARCVVAEQMYHYIRDAKSLLGCRSTVNMSFQLSRQTGQFLAVLKISAICTKYHTFEGVLSVLHGQTQYKSFCSL